VRTLRGRIGLALLAFALVTLMAVGGTLWVALRELHRDAAMGSLIELTAPYAGVVRARLPVAVLRPGTDEDGDFVEQLRSSAGKAGDELAAFLESFEQDVDQAAFSIIFVQGDSSYILNPANETASRLPQVPQLDGPLLRGQVATGTTQIEGIGDVLYAATPIVREPRRGRDTPLILLAAADNSAARATADLARALAVAALLLLIIGIPLALSLSRSVTRPLRRLSEATATVAKGKVPEPLPTGGPAEVAEASAAFNAMAAEVGATREAQRQLLADIRHDLRTPLTVIAGFSEALRDGTATGEVAVRAADAISDEAGRLERMLDDLDHLTVPGVAGPALRPETLDAQVVTAAAVERFAPEAESRGQDLRVAADHGTAGTVSLMADRDALDRILGNIVDNALAHAPSPGGHIVVECRHSGSLITLAVTDDGPGIPAASLPHVFDRFYRADPSRTRRGSGLGLAIVRDLAEALGGDAFAENVDGAGARVGVILPAMAAPSRDASAT